jgi:SP family facilitated glucose transporter-like MFS transporter 1
MIVGEFFTQGPRTAAISLAVLVNWTANVIVGQSFPPMFQYVTKDWTFVVFSVLLLFFCVFTFLFMPETKGKQPEEMSMYFRTNTFAFRQKTSSNQINIKKGEEQDDEVNSEGIITAF